MNRITSYLPANETAARTPKAPRPELRHRREADAMLRDFAFVLKITEQIKAEILAEKESIAV